MQFGAVTTITLLSAVALVGCFPTTPSAKEATPGDGGSSASGGATTSSGGVRSTGGASASGGASAVGGAAGRAGASGGTVATGGIANQTGGSNSSGGTGSAGSGAAGSAGVSGGASGGASGNCTDDAPPQQQTCAQWVEWNTCGQDWFKTYCNRSCGRCSGSSPSGQGGGAGRGGSGGSAGGAGGSGNSGAGGVSGPGTTNPPITGSNGFATRYWDCCKPSCSWTTAVPACQKDGTTRITDRNTQSACSNGSAYECYDFSPWYDASTNLSYGFVAHNGSCGTCYMLQFTGDGHSGPNAGATALRGQQMIVQAINIGNIAGDQFDVLIPGGGVGDFDACGKQFGFSSNTRYGGLLSDCKGDANCMKQKCQSSFGSIPALLAGCNWFTGWYSSADNPNVVYKQVPCPSQITSKSGIGG